MVSDWSDRKGPRVNIPMVCYQKLNIGFFGINSFQHQVSSDKKVLFSALNCCWNSVLYPSPLNKLLSDWFHLLKLVSNWVWKTIRWILQDFIPQFYRNGIPKLATTSFIFFLSSWYLISTSCLPFQLTSINLSFLYCLETCWNCVFIFFLLHS